ncbi:MAG TPA: MerR family transcriptional regulator [Azoarcus taiwanensis]|nr:MerR family transcriptional regulator [Azoarcus taiwanensis]
MQVPDATPSYPLSELCVLADLPVRTVRYYVQIGLVDRPVGETRAARYGPHHLEQLLSIKKWSSAGVSLERIRELLQGEAAPVPPRPRQPGSVAVCSHLHVAEGIEVVVEASRAGLSPERLRQFIQGVLALHREIAAQTGDEALSEAPNAEAPDTEATNNNTGQSR